jgi:hypothetical protein
MDLSPDATAEEAAAVAVHKAKSLQQAVETARELQTAEVIAETAKRVEASLLKGLREVFGDGDPKEPGQMKILVQRVPILCVAVKQTQDDIAEIKKNMDWAVKLIIGAVVVGLIALLFR